MNNFDVEEQLKKVNYQLPTKNETDLLWSKIEGKLTPKTPSVSAGSFRFPILNMFTNFYRQKSALALALIIIIALAGGSFATAALADSAKPGDTLFAVDLAVEKIRIALSGNTKKQELKVKFSEERVEEARIVLKDLNVSALADIESASSSSASSQDIKIKGLEQAEKALNTAVERLQKTKDELSKSGNSEAVAAIDAAIGKLNNLAKDHIADLEKIETKIKDNGEKLKIEIKTSNKELRNKFKFEIKNNNKGKDKDHEEEDESEVKLKIKIASRSHDDDDEDNDDEDDDEDDDKKIILCHIPSGNPGAKHTIIVGKSARKSHLAHGDTVGPCPSQGPTPTPTPTPTPSPSQTPIPDITAPLISGVTTFNTASTSAGIKWTTNESSDSRIWFSASSPINTSSSPSVSSNVMVTDHSFFLSGLTASTTYHFVVGSKDLAGNLATSSQSSFKTLKNDATPPVLTGLTISQISSTSATISWTTNENANSKVWFGTSSPFFITTATPFVENFGLVLNHSITLSGLTASTSYNYVISSDDASGNKATSTVFSFLTL